MVTVSVKLVFVALAVLSSFLTAATPTGLTALHRDGQTFLTWNDVSGAIAYNIYRSTTTTLSSTDLIPSHKVATIDSGSSYYKYWAEKNAAYFGGPLAGVLGSGHFRIENFGDTLLASQELFVWTTQETGGGTFHYAVTAVTGAGEDASIGPGNTLSVAEEECTVITPVELACSSDSSGHVFIMWMPYDKWNPQINGYAYHFYLGAKPAWKGVAKPFHFELHGRGAYYIWTNSSGIRTADQAYASDRLMYCVDDPHNTWFFGFADNVTPGNYGSFNAVDGSTVYNFTEYRMWCVLRWLRSDRSPWVVDTNRVTIKGGSMGGTGSYTFPIHHPEIFSLATSNEGINNWISVGATNPSASWSLDQAKWGYGKVLACRDLIPLNNSALISDRDVGFSSMGWQTVRDSLLPVITQRKDLPFFNLNHGTRDGTIEWLSQAMPIWSDHNNNKFSAYKIPYAGMWGNVAHVPFYSGGNACGDVPKNHFVLALKNSASDNHLADSCLLGNCTDSGQFNARVFWSTVQSAINGSPVDEPLVFETTLRLQTGNLYMLPPYAGPDPAYVDITPRRFQNLVNNPYTQYHWANIPAGSSTPIDSGDVTADEHGLFTIESFSFSSTGNKLRVTVTDSGVTGLKNVHGKGAPGPVLTVQPNPFNPRTRIMVSGISGQDQCEGIIYNVTGTIMWRFAVSGSQLSDGIVWDAGTLPSGVYMAKIISRDNIRAQRIILLK